MRITVAQSDILSSQIQKPSMELHSIQSLKNSFKQNNINFPYTRVIQK